MRCRQNMNDALSARTYVTGWTLSSDFPTANPLQPTLAGAVNAFVAKLAPDGRELVYSQYRSSKRKS
jgi:hypothetical protein